MRVSKTRFINYIRCDRYPALDEIHREREKAVVAFRDDAELEELMNEENKARTSLLLEDMYDDDKQDLLQSRDEQLEVMMPYYNQIEDLVGQAINNRYGGQIVYSMDTYQQKRFEYEQSGYRFYCFLDGYQEDEDHIRIFEVKATTSRKFVELTFKDEDKVKQPIFVETPEGHLTLRQDIGEPGNEDYRKKLKKLLNPLGDEGRYIYDIAYQGHVFKHAVNTNKKVSYYLCVLNSQYVYDGATDDEESPVYGDDIVTFIDVTALVLHMNSLLTQDIQKVIQRLDTMNASPVPLGSHCQRKDLRQCQFYPICYSHVPEENSLFAYMGNHHGFKDEHDHKHDRFELINDGKVGALDIPASWIQRPNNIIQRRVIESGQPYVHVEKIRSGIQALRYPIYHLDFETFPCPLPRYKGEKPYSQSLFQFSIHVESVPGVCDKARDHASFLAKDHRDCRQALVEAMLAVIKDDGGSVLVYNQAFEQTRIRELANYFPQHRARLEDIADRLFDLMHLLRSNTRLYTELGFEEAEAKTINYYHENLNGSYSIKKVLPLFSNLTYQTLSIGSGGDALTAYARMMDVDEKARESIRHNLLEYCQQDTWAMVVILDQLRGF